MRPHSLLLRLLPRSWASVFCSLVLLTELLLAQQHTPPPPLVLSVQGGIALGLGSAELFDGYRQATGLRANEYGVPIVPRASVAVEIGRLRFGVDGSYIRAESRETGSPTGATATTLDEMLVLQLVPVLTTFEWEPWQQQFRTFLRGGVGATFARFQWNERIWNNGILVRDGTRSDKRVVVPAMCIGAGVNLLFDEHHIAPVRGGLTIAMEYLLSPVRVEALRSYAALYDRPQWNEPINVGGSGLVLTLGVRFWLGNP